MKLYKMRSRFAIPLIKDTLCPHMEYFEHFAIIDVKCAYCKRETYNFSSSERTTRNGCRKTGLRTLLQEIGDHLFKLLIKQNIKIHIGPELKKPNRSCY